MIRYKVTITSSLGKTEHYELAGSAMDAVGKAWANVLLSAPNNTAVYHSSEVGIAEEPRHPTTHYYEEPFPRICPMEMQLGDVVRSAMGGFHAWGTSVVISRDDYEVTLFRPYVSVGDFSYCGRKEGQGSIITCIGVNQWKVLTSDMRKDFWLLERREIR